MRKGILFIYLILTCVIQTHAQYISIPDSAFVDWLYNNGYAKCIKGQKLNIGSPLVRNTQSLNLSGPENERGLIRSLEGIQYFSNLQSLYCSYQTIDSITQLPESLGVLDCSNNYLQNLRIPSQLKKAVCSNNLLSELHIQSNELEYLNIDNCHFSELNNLPDGIRYLSIRGCSYLNQIDHFPSAVRYIKADHCSDLNQIPVLPQKIKFASFNYCSLDSLPALPDSLETLYVGSNQLSSISNLPKNLKSLDCSSNNFLVLPHFPKGLVNLICGDNPHDPRYGHGWFELEQMERILESTEPDSIKYRMVDTIRYQKLKQISIRRCQLPDSLPGGLQFFDCGGNKWGKLPPLPKGLMYLYCGANELKILEDLPESLIEIYCDNNQISEIEKIPAALKVLYTYNSGLSNLPPHPNRLNEDIWTEELPIKP